MSLPAKNKTAVVVVSPENMPSSWQWIAKHFENVDWTFYRPQTIKGIPAFYIRLFAAGNAVLKSAKSDILVSHGPYMGFYCAIFKWCFCVRTPHIVYSFNFAELPQGFARARMQIAFNMVDKLVVASRMESELYAQHFKIPISKFEFVRWGVNRPDFNNLPPKLDGDYICAVGGNARDYGTFMDVMRDLPAIKAVVVVRPHNLVGLQIPDNVTVFSNIPKDDANSVIAHSKFMVLPLKGNEIPCGHVTIVVAMYLGVPTIVTNSSGIGDYIDDGATGLLCEPASKDSMKSAIVRLWQDSVLCASLSSEGKRFAETLCSEQNYATHFKQFMEQVVSNNG
jgi:glycosyltransferase involved in cell wall biosynthesis